ncbi:MAG TPA: thymidine phosphorylase, partial [Nitrospiria bacterium]|nr:thymidine phosphorylase [Nitrospiria bacterium]
LRKPVPASHRKTISAPHRGTVTAIENRKLARAAKLSGAPRAMGAGVELMTPVGTKVEKGEPLFVLYAENLGELDYAEEYVKSQKEIVRIEEAS